VIINREAGSVVPVDVAPDELLKGMRWLRGKPMPRETEIARVARET